MNLKKIDITMTATIRPTILEETLKSFTEKMLKDKTQYRLIINIDPIGEKLKKIGLMKEIINEYFNDTIINIPKEPGFTKAVQWCWSKTKEAYVFHLEDDWELLVDINIHNMIKILNSFPDLVSLRLNKINTGQSKHSSKYGFIYWPKISLNPTLLKGDFVRTIASLMDLNLNPEKQLRLSNTDRGRILSQVHHGIYTQDSIKQVVKDIGRNWMSKSKFTKKIGFMNWELK